MPITTFWTRTRSCTVPRKGDRRRSLVPSDRTGAPRRSSVNVLTTGRHCVPAQCRKTCAPRRAEPRMSKSVEATPELQEPDYVDVPEVYVDTRQAQMPTDERLQVQRLGRERAFEFAAAVGLAVVAVATAWSGYQATRWTDAQLAR